MSITIDGETFNVPIVGLDETCDFLDKFAERTRDGRLHRELIGIFLNQQIQFGSPVSDDERAQMTLLWAKLKEPAPFHTVTVPDLDGVPFTFEAYFANVKRSLRFDSPEKTYWKNITVNFIAQAPADTP